MVKGIRGRPPGSKKDLSKMIETSGTNKDVGTSTASPIQETPIVARVASPVSEKPESTIGGSVGGSLSLAHEAMEEFPPLAKENYQKVGSASAEKIKEDTAKNTTEQGETGENGVWNGKNMKVFMNKGLGAKLSFQKQKPGPVKLKMSDAIPVEKVWGYCLLGQYVGKFPGHKAFHDLKNTWGVEVRYKMDEGFIFFSFLNEEDREKVLVDGPYFINERPLFLKELPHMFAYNLDCLSAVPLWVRIHDLSQRFWNEECLSLIAAAIGVPMYMDPVTESRKRGSYARVLIEIDLAKDVQRMIEIEFEDSDLKLQCKIVIENEPKLCSHCKLFGHKRETCKKVQQEVVELQKDQTKKAEIEEKKGDDLMGADEVRAETVEKHATVTQAQDNIIKTAEKRNVNSGRVVQQPGIGTVQFHGRTQGSMSKGESSAAHAIKQKKEENLKQKPGGTEKQNGSVKIGGNGGKGGVT